MTTKLCAANLDALPPKIGRPSYRAADLKPGILHFGVGNFHRAHQAVYLDELFNAGEDRDWAIVGAGVFDAEKRGRDLLKAQDWLTTVVEQDTDHMEVRVTGSMVDYVTPGDGAAIISKLADPAIRIVSMTITEGGYFIDAATGRFDPKHPAIVADAQTPSEPKTVFGLMVEGLKRRKAQGSPPFTVMCCDNIPHNGHVTRDAVCGMAKLSDPAFAEWIEQNVAFPNAMVDRITPATSDRERAILKRDFGIEDMWPVFCEPFRQWVLEDNFPLGRPALEKVGVQFVDDVSPFELMKIRILNGGHAA
ncbi:MAG: mannitol dehydrogenase family protein, partial [Rhizobiaceae bacterium]|nr:mannitol dehydrogenase family protein [Rhizobiaceae bacterium]